MPTGPAPVPHGEDSVFGSARRCRPRPPEPASGQGGHSRHEPLRGAGRLWATVRTPVLDSRGDCGHATVALWTPHSHQPRREGSGKARTTPRWRRPRRTPLADPNHNPYEPWGREGSQNGFGHLVPKIPEQAPGRRREGLFRHAETAASVPTPERKGCDGASQRWGTLVSRPRRPSRPEACRGGAGMMRGMATACGLRLPADGPSKPRQDTWGFLIPHCLFVVGERHV